MSAAVAPAAVARPRPLAGAPPLVLAVLIYYWGHQYLRALLPEPNDSLSAYLLTVVPIALIAAAGVVGALLVARPVSGMPSFVPLLLFTALAAVVSIGRGDGATLLTAGLFALSLMWLGARPTRLSLATINRLFAASIIAGGAFYLAGWSDFGLLPGQYGEGADRGLEWRVSLFPLIPESAFFALIVLLANQLQGRGRSRWIWCSVALYFLVFSGLRSALIAFLLCETYVLLTAHAKVFARRGRCVLLVALLVLFLLSVAGSNALLLVPGIADGPLGVYLLRDAADDLSTESLGQSVYRSWLWLQHLDIFFSSPWIGVGSFEFSSLASESLIEGHAGSGSESFVTAWLARLGLATLPLFAYVGGLFAAAAGRPTPFDACLCLVLGVAAFAYGSFIVPYNFVFLLIFALLLDAPRRRHVRRFR